MDRRLPLPAAAQEAGEVEPRDGNAGDEPVADSNVRASDDDGLPAPARRHEGLHDDLGSADHLEGVVDAAAAGQRRERGGESFPRQCG